MDVGARPRLARSGHTFTPKRTRDYEKNLGELLKRFADEPKVGPVSLEIQFFMPMRKSWSKSKVSDIANKPHIQSPDVDNLVKSFCDAANGILFEDDSQVFSIKAMKAWSHESDLKGRITFILHAPTG